MVGPYAGNETALKVILSIEDENPIRELMEGVLEEGGYQSVSAENGLKGLEVVRSVKLDAIILDLNMPEMNGNEFLKELNLVGPDVPVIVVSANINELKVTPQVKAIISKPFDVNELLDVLEKIVKANENDITPTDPD